MGGQYIRAFWMDRMACCVVGWNELEVYGVLQNEVCGVGKQGRCLALPCCVHSG